MTNVTLDKITALAKRRSFVFQTSSIYGGLANNYDYGPYGTQLKNNIRDFWWKTFVTSRDNIVGIDGAILMQSDVWEASGHTSNFNEALVEDKVTNRRYRADHLIEKWVEKHKKNFNIIVDEMSIKDMNTFIADNKLLSPDGNPLSTITLFNQMFESDLDFMSEGKIRSVYLRPETAQSIFVNFKNITDSMRVTIPFGVAQIGKSFRKEITKGQFIFRTIETEQMEIEYFIHPDLDWEKIMQDWISNMKQFYINLGADENDLRFREHCEKELSHYSKKTFDSEYKFDFGWKEIAGLANRTDFDLQNHIKASNAKLKYRDPKTNEVFIPHVIEPSFGLARALLVAMYSAYTEEELENGSTRVVMKFPYNIAPVQAAIFPLQKDKQLQTIARSIYDKLKTKFICEFDNSGNIGKMYRRQDEIGTPFCITVDFDTVEKSTVTVRDRDSMKQDVVNCDSLDIFLSSKFK